MATRVAINGFGRIGRMFLRSVIQNPGDLEVVAINDLADRENLAYLLSYDSAQGPLNATVSLSDEGLIVNGAPIRVLSERDPAQLPWAAMNVDIVVEATGLFTKRNDAAKHLEAGAKKVIISAPAKDPDLTVVMGVNDDLYRPDEHNIVSNASCTTNCLAPVAKVIMDNFGIETGFLTTCHAFTSTQGLIDRPDKKDVRRGRAASMSIVPSSTGAATAVAKVLPELAGKLDGMALRVPTVTGSVVDFVVRTEKPISADLLLSAFRGAASSSMLGVLGLAPAPLVSCDIIGSPLSSIIDTQSTMVLGDYTAKILAWYDNEYGYASRVKDLVQMVGAKLAVTVHSA